MEEATRKATVHAVETILKKQKMTITTVKDVGIRLIETADPDSAFCEGSLAGTAFYLLVLHDCICLHVKPSHQVGLSLTFQAMRSWRKHGLAASACAAPEVGPKDTKSCHRFPCLQIHVRFCTGYDDAAATSFLQSTMGQRMQQQWLQLQRRNICKHVSTR